MTYDLRCYVLDALEVLSLLRERRDDVAESYIASLEPRSKSRAVEPVDGRRRDDENASDAEILEAQRFEGAGRYQDVE